MKADGNAFAASNYRERRRTGRGKHGKNERITRSGYRIDASRIGKDVAKRELHRFSISRLDGNGGIDMW